ncbi:MAG: methyltransferase [Balneolaceae bacterium]
MAKIEYDPVKDRLASMVRGSSFLRRLFYALLDLLFLRSWHMRKVIVGQGLRFEELGKWKLLDAGSGFGQYDRFLLDRFCGLEITALDVKEKYLEDCRDYFKKERKAGRIRFRLADLREIDFGPTFDMAICIDVLEHIDEDLEVIRRISDSLKPGGVFLMHSPSHLSEEDGGEEDSFVGEHARPGYSAEEISDKLKRCGLEPIRVRYTYGRFGHLAWTLSVRNPMIWLNRTGIWGLLPLLIYYPFIIIPSLFLNLADLWREDGSGTGILAIGQKVPRTGFEPPEHRYGSGGRPRYIVQT